MSETSGSVGAGRMGRAAGPVPGDRRRVLTDALRERIVEMAEAGSGSGRIAGALGLRQPTVAGFMATRGLSRGRQVDVGVAFGGRRGGRRFGREEDALVERMAVDGASYREIATACSEAFGHPRRARTIRARLVSLATVAGAAD